VQARDRAAAVAALLDAARVQPVPLTCVRHAVEVVDAGAPAAPLQLLEVDAAPGSDGRGARGKRRGDARQDGGVLQPAGLLVSGDGVAPLPGAPPAPQQRVAADGAAARFAQARSEAGDASSAAGGLRCSCEAYDCTCPRRCACSLLGDGGQRLMDNATLLQPPVAAPAKPFPSAYTFRCDCGFTVVRASRDFESLACTCDSADAGACACRRRCTCTQG
jgi:hypothetical protein